MRIFLYVTTSYITKFYTFAHYIYIKAFFDRVYLILYNMFII